MGGFWESWELWEKMTFVMGMAIVRTPPSQHTVLPHTVLDPTLTHRQVLTVLAGLLKLAHKTHQVRAFTQQARRRHELEAQHPTHPEMTDASAQRVRRGRAAARKAADPDVPFGVRAIESGVEVAGVWISRGTSPSSTPPGGHSPAGPAAATPSASEDTGVRSGVPAIVLPEPALPYSAGHGRASSAESQRTPIAEGKEAGDTRRTLSPPESHRGSTREPPSPGLGAGPRRARPSYKPRHSSGLRFSALDPEFDHDAAQHGHGGDSQGSRASSGQSDPTAPNAFAELYTVDPTQCCTLQQPDARAEAAVPPIAVSQSCTYRPPSDAEEAAAEQRLHDGYPAFWQTRREYAAAERARAAREAVDLLPFTHDSRAAAGAAAAAPPSHVAPSGCRSAPVDDFFDCVARPACSYPGPWGEPPRPSDPSADGARRERGWGVGAHAAAAASTGSSAEHCPQGSV